MFSDTLYRFMESVRDATSRDLLRRTLHPVFGRLSNVMLTTGGLAIKAGGSALVKAGTLSYVVAGGQLRSIAANTDMAALAGTVTTAKANVFAFFVNKAGTLTSAMGVEGAALANVVFPPVPNDAACIGFVIIAPTGTGNFVGGTTALDDGTVVPAAVYVNTPCGFDPQCIVGTAVG